MEARELAELAALVAAHGPVLITTGEPIDARHIEDYWIASRCRLDRWGRVLRKYQVESATLDAPWAENQWLAIRPTMEEVLTSEMLARVWTAVVSAYDRQHARRDGELVVRSVLVGHAEARNRVLTGILHGPSGGPGPVNEINQLRSRCEKWTDVLIGYLLNIEDVSEFAFDPDRARDFAESLDFQRRMGNGPQSWKLTLGSVRAAFRASLCERTASPDLNAQIAASILNCFPPSLFDGTGLVRSIWLTRMQNVTSDAEGMIDDLLSLEETPHQPTLYRPRW